MRIGIDATALPANPAGAGTYTSELIRALAQIDAPHEWFIFTHPGGKAYINLPDKPSLHWVLTPQKSPLRRLIWEQTVFPFLVHRLKLELLHSLHYTRPIFLPCPSVVTFHDMTFFLYPQVHTRSKRFFFPAAIRFSARTASALIAVSESTRRDAIRLLNIPAAKIYTTPNGVSPVFRPVSDPQRLQACREKHHLPDKFILFVGTIEPRKNLPLLLKAYHGLLSSPPWMQAVPSLVLAGQMGWMVNDVLHQIETLGLQEKVHLTGYIPPEELPLVYNLASVFVYPSIYEGFGLPALEAMACGTPVITTNTSAMADYVGDAGILVPPNNQEALVQAMQTLLMDQDLQHSLAQKGQEQAAQFTWERTAQETLKVYELASV